MAQDDGKLIAYAMLGFGAGLYIFFKGFHQFRNYLLIADTPEIPIRSVPMGFVEIHGTAAGEKTVPSPVSHTPCFLYKVVIERWESQSGGKGSRWVHHRTDVDGPGFYLTDGTGKVRVDAHGAELDLPQTVRCTAGEGSSAATGAAATTQELLQYVSQADAHWAGSWVERGLKFAGPVGDSGKERQREALMGVFQHTPGTPEFLQGMITMMAPRMKQQLESMGPQSDPSHEQARQTMLEAFQHPLGSPEFLAGARRAEQLAGESGSNHELDILTRAFGGDPGTATGVFGAASGRYRFTEYCVVPGSPYDVSGTCVENPHPLDPSDRNLIVKGTNEKVFLISYKTEKQVESGLRRRAVLMVFGGAALSVGCMAFLLAKFGLL